jgi:2-deoxy-D-gluconate 3-dehydrogenase
MVLKEFDLTGKVAVVTGCNSGLGQGMAWGLAQAGADIAGVYRSDVSETKQVIESLGRKFVGIEADLLEVKTPGSVIERAIEAFGKIDILVNNAGTIRRSEALEHSVQDWDDVVDINLKTVFYISQRAAKQFIKQGTGGKIINIASMLSYQGGVRVVSYTASKHGIMGITRALANEWAEYNINVNAIAPGYMLTKLTAPLEEDEKRSNEILSRIPAGRWGTPEDMQGTVVFLASDASNYVNGHTIAVDGGWLSR